MNSSQEKSLQLIDDLLDSMDDATFLKEHEAVEKNIGPTIEFFTSKYYFNDFIELATIKSFEKLQSHQYHSEAIKPSYKEEINTYSANDEIYLEQQLAT